MDVEIGKFQGGRSWMVRAGVIGVIFLALTVVLGLKDPRTALFSYLVGYTFWAGVALASLVLLMIFHTFHAKWMVVLRRPLEAIAATLPFFVLLFIPIAAGMKHLYTWVQPGPLSEEQRHLLEHKGPYLNVTAFLVRTVIYFIIAGYLGRRLFGLSTRQDETGDVQLTVRQRRLSAGGLPFIAVVFAFAAFDWLMSLNPFWFSTMFGVYYFAGSFVTAISLIAILNWRARGKDLYGDYVSPEHSHNIGKLMLAFTAFWAYIGFSQFMLIWIAGLPEEIPFFTVRMRGAWAPLGVFLIFGHFFLPFFTLLSKNLKRKPGRLAVVAIWMFVVHFADLYWLVIPTLSPDAFVFPLSVVTAFLGVGGVAVAAGIWTIRGHFTVPVKDPFLSVSLRYRQP
ncbi:MAG TPA: hypothetical protein VIJ61_00325 [Thermoanaerobaculia bacterium]